jgi:uncharacterized protein YjbI with pentapeptide repeats
MENSPRKGRVFIIFLFLFLYAKDIAISDGSIVIRAEDVLAKIEKNEIVDYENVNLIGDLDLSKMNSQTPGFVSSSIKFKNSEIYGIINFNNTILKEKVTFEKTVFHEPAYFFQTRFQEGADFSSSQFDENALFRKCFINHSAEFGEVRFRGFSDFRESVIIADIANFRGSYFEDTANFLATTFSVQTANFEWSHFKGPARFWHSIFGPLANFRGSYFEDIADLYEVQFNETADFFGARFDKSLYFNDVKFKTFRVQWSSIEYILECNGPPYLLLIKNFKEQEQFEDADNCYFQYRNWKRDGRNIGWPKLFDYIAWISCGYGVRWHHTILSGFLAVILFGIYFELDYLIRAAINLIQKKNLVSSMSYDLAGNLKKSISISALIILSLPPEWYSSYSEAYKKLVNSHIYSATLERLIGWGLMLLIIGTLSRLMVRY